VSHSYQTSFDFSRLDFNLDCGLHDHEVPINYTWFALTFGSGIDQTHQHLGLALAKPNALS